MKYWDEVVRTAQFPTSGAIACAYRFVKVDSGGYLALAGATDANCIGAATSSAAGATGPHVGPPAYDDSPGVTLLNCQRAMIVEVATGVTVAIGDVVYQASSGKCTNSSAGGAVRRGVALTAGDEGETVELLSC